MLYLVGGVARAGKSMTATTMQRQLGVPYLSLDALRWGLTKGAPCLGIHSDNDDQEDSKRLWPILEAMIENILFDGRDYLIEGVCFIPELVATCIHTNPDSVRACFLGCPDVGLDKKVAATMNYEGPNDWLRRLSSEVVHEFIAGAIQRSIRLRSECAATDIPFIDSGGNFSQAISKAMDALTV